MSKTMFCLFLLLISNSLAQTLQFEPEQPLIDAHMQSSDDWRVAFYDQGMRAVVLVTSDGVETIRISDDIFASDPEEDEIYTTNLSPDGRYFLMTLTVWNISIRPTILIDLTTPDRYIELPEPLLEPDEDFVGYNHWDHGAFSPDGREVALAYTSYDYDIGGGCCNSGGIVTIDLASGQIVHQLTSTQFQSFGTYGGNTAWIGDWTEAGIEYAPRCSNCTPIYEVLYHVWEPVANTVEDTTTFDRYDRVERLASTSEFLYSHSRPDYPPGDYSILIKPVNLVEIYQLGETPFAGDGQVVFHDIDFRDFEPARWVVGGQAFLVQRELAAKLVFRDGFQFDFEFASEQTFLGMTPNGWLMGDNVDGHIFHYHYHDGDLSIDEIADLQGSFQRMGELNTGFSNLPDFMISIPPPDEFFCPGSLPTNLAIGDTAEVIVYDPDVYAIWQFIILDENGEWQGEYEVLPLGATVRILDGPTCDNPGLLYWTVEYEGVTGRMAEVSRTAYILRPLD